jgi:hypothetical protein
MISIRRTKAEEEKEATRREEMVKERMDLHPLLFLLLLLPSINSSQALVVLDNQRRPSYRGSILD